MDNKADVVIVGGGATGLGLAYHLLERGMKKVVVLEKGYIAMGATGRLPGVVTQQYPALEEITLAREGIKILEHLSGELKFNVMFRQQGSLILAFTEEQVENLEISLRFQNLLKLNSKLLGPGEIKKIVPMLDVEKILGGAFCPADGLVYPYALSWGYDQAIKRWGGEVHTFTEVKGIKVENGKVKAVLTNRGEIEAPIVVNAAGANSAKIANMAGVKLINQIRGREFLVTEPLKQYLNPTINSARNGLYMAQTMRGETICSLPSPNDASSDGIISSIDFLQALARAVLEIMQGFSNLQVMRQWTGLYDVTPDGKPVLGETEVLGFIQANGFGDHGLELPIAAAKLLAELIVDGRVSPLLEPFSAVRFVEKKTTQKNSPDA